MGANSAIRKVIKTILYPIANETTYKYFQAASKAWDIKNGAWSEPELDLIEIGLREGETTLDIGANYGVYAYYMSKTVGKDGKVYSFEPVPFTYQTLCIIGKILGFAKNTELIDKGCSNENGKIKFTVPVQESGAFAAGQAYIEGRNDNREGKDLQVKWASTKNVEAHVVKLDDFLPEIKDIPLIKADIEGAELFAFHGAEKLFEKHLPTTICEINPWFLEGFNVKLDDLLNFFFEKGYKMFHYTNNNGKRLREITRDEIAEDNYVFIHPSRFERFKDLL